jgi:hypothetical protein
MSFLPKKQRIVPKTYRRSSLDNHAEKENYISNDRFNGRSVFDNVYLLFQSLPIQDLANLTFCSPEVQRSHDSKKVGLHYGTSKRAVSDRLSHIGVHLISANPTMLTALVPSGFGIVLEGIVKAIVRSLHLSSHDITDTEWMYNCQAIIDEIISQLRQFNTSGIFFGVCRDAMESFKKHSNSEGCTLTQHEEAQLLNMVPDNVIRPLRTAAQTWLSSGVNTLYPSIQSSVGVQQVATLFDGNLGEAVRPLLSDLDESMNLRSSVVFLICPADEIATSTYGALNTPSKSVFYFISRTTATNLNDRCFSCQLEIGYVEASNALTRVRSYQHSNPTGITALLILLPSKDVAVSFESLVKQSFNKQRRKGEEFLFLATQTTLVVKSCIQTARRQPTSFLGSESSIIGSTFEHHIPSYPVRMSSLAVLDAAKRDCLQVSLCIPRTLRTQSLPFQEVTGVLTRNEWDNLLHGLLLYCTGDMSRASFEKIFCDLQLGFNHTRNTQWLRKESIKLLSHIERDNNSNVWGAMCSATNPARYLFDQLGFHGRPLPQCVDDSLAMKWELHVSNEFKYDCIMDEYAALDRITTLR